MKLIIIIDQELSQGGKTIFRGGGEMPPLHPPKKNLSCRCIYIYTLLALCYGVAKVYKVLYM